MIGGIYRKHPNEKDFQRAKVFAKQLIPQKPIQKLALSGETPPHA
jgi:hypothetical protein